MDAATERKLLESLGAKDAPGPAEEAIFARARAWCRRAAWIPGIRMVAVCNSATFFAADEDSDIDLFVVTAPRRMWLARVALTAFFHLCGVRRHGDKVAGRMCLSFFCTTDALDFSAIALPGGDPYLEAWVPRIVPVLDRGGTADAFWDANASWAPTDPATRAKNRRRAAGPAPKLAAVADFFERWTPRILDLKDAAMCKPLLPRTLRHWECLGKPWGVVVNASMLKFHDKDRRKEIRDELGKAK